jgi:pSer/pThr/pTyr-binding forkhead associated (FHA) protein
MRLSQYAELARTLDVTSFVARRPEPVLLPTDVFPAAERGRSPQTPDRLKLPRTAIVRSTEPSTQPWADETSFDEVMSPLAGAVAEATPPSGILRADPEPIPVVKSRRDSSLEEITVGRSKDNDIVLDDKGVSKAHARFVRTDFRYWLHDRSSTNGTYIDDSCVPPTGLPLADGARVSFGPRLTFKFFTARGLHQFLIGR